MSDSTPYSDARSGAETTTYNGYLWRLYRTRGRHRAAWNQFRPYGEIMALYGAADALMPFAEVFKRTRVIDPSATSGWCLAGWKPTRVLTLSNAGDRHVHLGPEDPGHDIAGDDITGDDVAGDDIDGIRGRPGRPGDTAVTLFDRSADTFPEAPQFNRLLAGMPSVVAEAAERLGFGIRNY